MHETLISQRRYSSLPVLCVVGLALIAHVLPAAQENDRSYMGWEVASEVILSFADVPSVAWRGQLDLREWFVLIGSLSNPLFWLGIAALLLSGRLSPRRTGVFAALSGVLGLACTPAFLLVPNIDAITLQPGFYVWVASLFLLVITGIWRAAQPPRTSSQPCQSS